jgi:hypothetical protein
LPLLNRLSAPIRNYGDIFAVIFFHRRGAKDAERKYLLFAVERTANKKIQALGANHKSDLRIAWFGNNVKFMSEVNLIK